MDNGTLVPDDIIISLIGNEIKKLINQNYLLDGKWRRRRMRSISCLNLSYKCKWVFWHRRRIPEDIGAGKTATGTVSGQYRAESRGAHSRYIGSCQEQMGPSA